MSYVQKKQIEQSPVGSNVLNPGGNLQQQQQAGQQQGQPVGGSSSPAMITDGQPSTQPGPQQNKPAPVTAPKKASSGQFTNLKSYLQANQGGAGRMGQALGKDVTGQATQVGQAITQQKDQYASQVAGQQEQLAGAQGQVNTIIGNIMGTNVATPEYSTFTDPSMRLGNWKPTPYTMGKEDLDGGERLPKQGEIESNAARLENLKKDYNPHDTQIRELRELDSITDANDKRIADKYNKEAEEFNARLQADRDAYDAYQTALNTVYDPSQEDIGYFSDLMSGNVNFENVQAMNLAKEQLAAQDLEKRAGDLKSFEGRTGRLRELFGQRREYGSGSASLDSLLLQKDPALKELLDQTSGAVTGVQEGIKGARDFSAAQAAQLLKDNDAFRTGIGTKFSDLTGGITSDVDARAAQAKIDRQAYIDTMLNPQKQAEMAELDQLSDYYSEQNFNKRLSDSLSQTLKEKPGYIWNIASQMREQELRNAGNNPAERSRIFAKYAQNQTGINNVMAEINKMGETGQWFGGNLSLGGSNWNADLDAVLKRAMYGDLDAETRANIGDIYGANTRGSIFNRFQGQSVSMADLNKERARIQEVLGRQRSDFESQLKDQIARESGVDYDTFMGGADISRESIASGQDRARYLALQRLAGRTSENFALERPQDAIYGKNPNEQFYSNLRARFGRTGGNLQGPVTNIG